MARETGPGSRMEETGERFAGAHDETKWAPLTTEFWAMLLESNPVSKVHARVYQTVPCSTS